MQCVVPENIHTPRPLTEGNGSSEGRWSPKGGNFRGGGVASRVFCLGALSKIDEQAISYSGGSREGGPHLFVDQTEAQRTKKLFLETTAPPPPYLRGGWAPPLISSSGSGTPLFYLWMVFQSKKCCFHRRFVICGWLSAFFMACMIVYVRLLLATNE